ncbi:hypothetical protein BN1708_008715 [Verticillium longisporum]|uniref:Uncharacterized protein n=1 Tax=Verticillium longisporum TaxID=100787 RepID=A0A0G4N7A0_VERLO|nr:hypothetical protein BN1708_008715 [Verticillium longisporum]
MQSLGREAVTEILLVVTVILVIIILLLLGVLEPLDENPTPLPHGGHALAGRGPLVAPPRDNGLLLEHVEAVELLQQRGEDGAGARGLEGADVDEGLLQREDKLALLGLAAADADLADEGRGAAAGGEGGVGGLGGLEGAVGGGQELGGAAGKGDGDGLAHLHVGRVVGEAETHKLELGRVEIARVVAQRVEEAVHGVLVEGGRRRRRFAAAARVVRGEGREAVARLVGRQRRVVVVVAKVRVEVGRERREGGSAEGELGEVVQEGALEDGRVFVVKVFGFGVDVGGAAAARTQQLCVWVDGLAVVGEGGDDCVFGQVNVVADRHLGREHGTFADRRLLAHDGRVAENRSPDNGAVGNNGIVPDEAVLDGHVDANGAPPADDAATDCAA